MTGNDRASTLSGDLSPFNEHIFKDIERCLGSFRPRLNPADMRLHGSHDESL